MVFQSVKGNILPMTTISEKFSIDRVSNRTIEIEPAAGECDKWVCTINKRCNAPSVMMIQNATIASVVQKLQAIERIKPNRIMLTRSHDREYSIIHSVNKRRR